MILNYINFGLHYIWVSKILCNFYFKSVYFGMVDFRLFDFRFTKLILQRNRFGGKYLDMVGFDLD